MSVFGRSDREESRFKAQCVTVNVIYCCEMEKKTMNASHIKSLKEITVVFIH